MHLCVRFTVKADGTQTDCGTDNANCPANADCATDVCNCNAGWIHDGSGLCTGMDSYFKTRCLWKIT